MSRGAAQMLPEDLGHYLARKFAPADLAEARRLLETAVIHDGSPAEARLRRCAAVASHGDIGKLRAEVARLKVDYRDVIVAGEYQPTGLKLKKVRNLSDPIPEDL